MNLESNQLLLLHAKNMYRAGIIRFPKCNPLRISYAFFLIEKLNKKTEALHEITQVEKQNLKLEEQFVIYRYKKLTEEYGDGPMD